MSSSKVPSFTLETTLQYLNKLRQTYYILNKVISRQTKTHHIAARRNKKLDSAASKTIITKIYTPTLQTVLPQFLLRTEGNLLIFLILRTC